MSVVFRTRVWPERHLFQCYAFDDQTGFKLAQAFVVEDGPTGEVVGTERLLEATSEVASGFAHYLILASLKRGLRKLWGDCPHKLAAHYVEVYGWSLEGTTGEGLCRVKRVIETAEV